MGVTTRTGRLRVTAGLAVASWVLSVASCAATAATRLDLLDLQVFAKRSIHAERSDYQGSVAAGGDVDLTDFDVGGDLTAGGRVTFRRGQVKGFVHAPDARLSQVFSSGVGAVADPSMDLAAMKLDLLGARLAGLPATVEVAASQEADGRPRFQATAGLGLGLDVVDLDGDRLAGPDGSLLVLAGARDASLVVRIHGARVRLDRVGFALEGGLGPSQVVFLFPEATDLDISSSGGAAGADGEPLHIPGSIVAPRAALRFAASTVTGQVFVRSIDTMPGQPAGQVNSLPRETMGGPVRPPTSPLLRRVAADDFVGASPAQPFPRRWSPRPVPAAGWPEGCRLVCTAPPEPVSQ